MPTLGDRMKTYEHTYRSYLPRRTYTLLRLDGRGFSNYTRNMDKPFDGHFITAMDSTAIALAREIAGTKLAYVQSDEISLLVTDFDNHETQPWVGGNIAKVLSLSASCATATFNAAIGDRNGDAMFDSRVWTMSDANEVANYFIWRQRDAIRNSISMYAGHYFSHKELEGKTANDRLQMLDEIDKDWFKLPVGIQRGRAVYKRITIVDDEVTRSSWEIMPAVPFKITPGHWLPAMIPPLPSLPRDVQDPV